MTYREMMEAIEPGGPPYGVMEGARLDFRGWLEQLSESNMELMLTPDNGDMVHFAHSHRKEEK